MRTLIFGSCVVISLAFLAPMAPVSALAQEACNCKGCGCKGGPGWRGPSGYCVSQAKLEQICGSPPGSPCIQEAAPRVCFTGETASSPPKTETP